MIYLYLDGKTIKLLSLTKTLFGQYTVSSFQKQHTSPLLEKGRVITVDLLASAVKEALTLAGPTKIKEKEVCLILPQASFEFARYDIPQDISEAAIKPFIEDKVRAQSSFLLDEVLFDYILIRQHQESKVLFFAQHKEVFRQYREALQLLGLSVEYLVPDTVCCFTLFAKTLRTDKKENILYVFYQDGPSQGYLYDSLGLLKKDQLHFKSPLETSLHATAADLAEKQTKLNRIILSGRPSENIRQDLFTKKVGVWTNPLKKILTTFYQDYLKLLATANQSLPLLDFDVCFGAFIGHMENTVFSVKEMAKSQPKQRALAFSQGRRFAFPRLHGRDVVVFLISFIISFALIFFFPRLRTVIKLPRQSVKPTSVLPSPTAPPSPTPTPIIDKATLAIKILNGAGIKGKAGEAKDILKEKGYREILTGNADNFDYNQTEIQVKADQKAVAELLKNDLSDVVDIQKISNLEPSAAPDVMIIIGKDFE